MNDGARTYQRQPNQLMIVLCFLVATLEGFDFQVIGVAAPQLVRALKMSPQMIGVAFSASLVGLAIGAVLGGRLADRIGRKPVLVCAVLVMGVFTLASAAAWDANSLLLMRFLTGLGLGGSMPNIIAIVSEVALKKRRTLLVATISCGFALGGILLSLLARFSPGGMDWRTLFIVGGVLPLLVGPALQIWLIETGSGTRQRPAARVGFASALFGPGQITSTLSLWFAFALTLLQLSLLLNWMPTIVIAKGFPPQEAFTSSLILNVGSIAGSIIVGWLCDRLGARWPMVAVYLGMTATMFGLSLASTLTPIFLFAFAAGFLVLGTQFVLYGLAPKIYPLENRAFGVGVAVAVGRIGAIVGPLIAGQMIGGGATANQVLLLMVPMVLCAGIAVTVLTFSAGDLLAAEDH